MAIDARLCVIPRTPLEGANLFTTRILDWRERCPRETDDNARDNLRGALKVHDLTYEVLRLHWNTLGRTDSPGK